MSIEWLVVKKADNRISGWHRSGKGTETPPDTVIDKFIEADQALVNLYRAADVESRADGRSATVQWDDVLLIPFVPPDTRPTFRFVINPELQAGVIAAITATALLPDTRTDTAFNETVFFDLFADGEIYRLQFVNGIASRNITPIKPGIFGVFSHDNAKVEIAKRVTVYR